MPPNLTIYFIAEKQLPTVINHFTLAAIGKMAYLTLSGHMGRKGASKSHWKQRSVRPCFPTSNCSILEELEAESANKKLVGVKEVSYEVQRDSISILVGDKFRLG
ncbi:hypothetical protein PV328_000708 [Microctonus aethiopoides]|uniref:Uncharacterized protein n=1 Tax=Microctonus aethiopoides TaxID=144406 RepID=A0AA39KWQ6_9HYME|nr:hypothetical protein PV328_000708 [Microctonus aethiopoides]